MTSRTRRRLLLASLLLASCRTAAGAQVAQSTMILPLQSLSFGLLMPGIADRVTTADAARRAVVAMTGSNAVDITFVLPAGLDAPDGSRIPLLFGAADAGYMQSIGGAVLPLNPKQVSRVQLTRNGIALLLLGGTAAPTTAQRPGQYSARVLVIVSPPGT